MLDFEIASQASTQTLSNNMNAWPGCNASTQCIDESIFDKLDKKPKSRSRFLATFSFMKDAGADQGQPAL